MKSTEPIYDDLTTVLSTSAGDVLKDDQKQIFEERFDWGTLTLRVEESCMQAVLTNASVSKFVGSPQVFLDALEQMGIVYGIDVGAVLELSNLVGNGTWAGELVIARGLEPLTNAQVTYPILEGLGALNFAELHRLFANRDIEAFEASGLKVCAVAPNTVVGVIETGSSSDLGKDVFGNCIDVPYHLLPQPGIQVVARDDKTYVSEGYGYLCIFDQRISVIPPVLVAADLLSVFYADVPQVGHSILPTEQQIMDLLKKSAVRSGILKDAIRKVAQGLPRSQVNLTTIVQSKVPVQGQDGSTSFAIDLSQRPGKILDNGSIDLRERNLIHNVNAGDLLARKMPPQKGVDGETVFGKKISASHGKECVLEAGEGVEVKKETDGIVAYYASTDGAVVCNNDHLCVHRIFRVSQDVDFSTGNIDVDQDVYIPGSVRSGFTVKAGGNITVVGSVENGTTIRAKGNLDVGKGIIGEKTRVVVKGNIRSRFVQNAHVMAKGDIWVGSYVHNAMMRSGGKVIVAANGGLRGGSIVGGKVGASGGISAMSAGSKLTKGTILAIEPDLGICLDQEKLGKDIHFCDTNIAKMMRTLGIDQLDKDSIQEMLKQASEGKEALYAKIVAKMRDLIKHREVALAAKQKLQKEAEKSIGLADIRILKQIYPGIVVKIGEKERWITESLANVRFDLEKDQICIRANSKAQMSEKFFTHH